MVRGGRREEGSGWGTRVYLWQNHFDVWQNQYNIVKLKNKIKKKVSQYSGNLKYGTRLDILKCILYHIDILIFIHKYCQNSSSTNSNPFLEYYMHSVFLLCL